MSCLKYRELLIEAARGGEVPAHARSCGECGAFLARQIKLSATMAELRAVSDIAALAACPLPIARKPFHWRYAAAVGSLAAALVLAWIFYPAKLPVQMAVAMKTPSSTKAILPGRDGRRIEDTRPVNAPGKRRAIHKKHTPEIPRQEFVSIPYTVPLGRGERAQVWRMDLPVSELIAAGVPVSAPDTSSMARADIVVGEDGRARAYRLISISDNTSQRSIYK